MKRYIKGIVMFALTVSVGLFLMVRVASAAPDMNPGQWEITTTMEMVGVPMKMPSITTKQCLTKDDLVPKQPSRPGVKQPCEVKNTKVEGNTVSWDMVCSDQNQTSGHGEVTYHGDTFEGTIQMNSTLSGKQKMQMILHMKGKRIGACE